MDRNFCKVRVLQMDNFIRLVFVIIAASSFDAVAGTTRGDLSVSGNISAVSDDNTGATKIIDTQNSDTNNTLSVYADGSAEFGHRVGYKVEVGADNGYLTARRLTGKEVIANSAIVTDEIQNYTTTSIVSIQGGGAEKTGGSYLDLSHRNTAGAQGNFKLVGQKNSGTGALVDSLIKGVVVGVTLSQNGGNLSVQGGDAASDGNSDGGAVIIDGGVGYGSGVDGDILLQTVESGGVGIGTTDPGGLLGFTDSATYIDTDSGDLRFTDTNAGTITLSAIVGADLWDRFTGTPNYLLPDTAADDLGATGARITKGLFADLESTNMPTVGGTSLDANGVITGPTSGEVTQIEAIGATTISAGQWGYVGGADQAVKQADSPTFAGATITGFSGVVQSTAGVLSASTAIADGTTATTQSPGDDDTSLATTAFVEARSSAVSLTADVSGVLPVANGGTNSSTALNNDFVMISSSGAVAESAAISTTELGYLDGQDQSVATTDSPTFSNATIGVAGAGVDYTLTFDGETTDGVLTWLEDESQLQSDSDLLIKRTDDPNLTIHSTGGTLAPAVRLIREDGGTRDWEMEAQGGFLYFKDSSDEGASWNSQTSRLSAVAGINIYNGSIDVETDLDPLTDLNDTADYHIIARHDAATNDVGAGIAFSVSDTSSNVGAAIIHERIASNSQGKLHFYTKQSTTGGVDPVVAMTIDEDGEVGIGTETPTTALHINGDFRQIIHTDDVSIPPTDAEFDAIFGTPATVGAGFIGLIDDNGEDNIIWRAISSGTSWFYMSVGTKAL